MTSEPNGHAAADCTPEPRVVVCAEDTVDARLAGHAGGVYCSPPQSQEQARELVELLVGHPVPTLGEDMSWRVPVAGGRRIVTIRTASA